MRVPYVVSFRAYRFFERQDELLWGLCLAPDEEDFESTIEFVLEHFSDLLNMFDDVSMDAADEHTNLKAGYLEGIEADLQVKHRGEVEVPDYACDAEIAIAALADFRQKARDGLDEIERIDQLSVEFPQSNGGKPIQFSLS